MRVLFVFHHLYMEPLGIMYLSSVLKQAGHETELAVIKEQDVVGAAQRFRPDVVAYSLHSGVQQFHLALNTRLKKEMSFFAAFGGPHPTFFPEMIRDENVDGLCLGEGEDALLDLVLRLERGQPLDNLQSWWLRSNGGIQRNPVAPLIEDLNTLPFPDRALMRSKEHLLRYEGQRSVMTARGCPYNCSYCFNHAYAELYHGETKRVRRRSVDNVIEELIELKLDHNLRFVYFADDTFNMGHEWLAEFAQKYPKKVGVPFLCNIRANLVTLEQMRLIADAGAHSVCMGIETGDEHLRNVVLKRGMRDEQIHQAAQITHDLGLRLFTTNMLGIPTGSIEHDLETVRMNQRIKPHATMVALLQPYPRTKIRDFAESRGLLQGTAEDIPSSFNWVTLIKMDTRERRQVKNLRHLFVFFVQAPWLMPAARFLVSLPLTRLYEVLGMVFNGYLVNTHIFKQATSFKSFWRSIRFRFKETWPFHIK